MSEETNQPASETAEGYYYDSPLEIVSQSLETITTLMDVELVEEYPDFKSDKAKIIISCMHLITLSNKKMKADLQAQMKKNQ